MAINLIGANVFYFFLLSDKNALLTQNIWFIREPYCMSSRGVALDTVRRTDMFMYLFFCEIEETSLWWIKVKLDVDLAGFFCFGLLDLSLLLVSMENKRCFGDWWIPYIYKHMYLIITHMIWKNQEHRLIRWSFHVECCCFLWIMIIKILIIIFFCSALLFDILVLFECSCLCYWSTIIFW